MKKWNHKTYTGFIGTIVFLVILCLMIYPKLLTHLSYQVVEKAGWTWRYPSI